MTAAAGDGGAPPPLSGARARGLTASVLELALPAVATGFVALAYHWVNQFWVDVLATEGPGGFAALWEGREARAAARARAGGGPWTVAPTALSVAVFFAWALNSTTQLVVSGLTALVARYVGAGRRAPAAYVGLQGVRWAWVVAVAVGVLGSVVADPVLESTGISEAARAQAVAYVRVIFGGGVAWMTLAACDAVFRAHGDARTPLLVHAVALALNACLDPLLIFGVGPFPALGVAGSAVSTVGCWTLASLASLAILSRRGLLARARPADDEMRLNDATPLDAGPLPGLDLAVARRVVRVGAPSCAQGLFFVAVYLTLSRVVTETGGDAAQAGLGIGLRGEQVAFVLCSGFAVAAANLVGQRLGARRPDDAARAAWRSVLLCAAACGAWALVLGFLDGHVAGLLHAPADAEPYARSYYRIVALALVPQAFEIVLDGAFAGAGMTLPPMLVSIALAAARVPLAWWAATDLGLGVAGIWWAISATAVVRGVVIALWFARGTWKAQTV